MTDMKTTKINTRSKKIKNVKETKENPKDNRKKHINSMVLENKVKFS